MVNPCNIRDFFLNLQQIICKEQLKLWQFHINLNETKFHIDKFNKI